MIKQRNTEEEASLSYSVTALTIVYKLGFDECLSIEDFKLRREGGASPEDVRRVSGPLNTYALLTILLGLSSVIGPLVQ